MHLGIGPARDFRISSGFKRLQKQKQNLQLPPMFPQVAKGLFNLGEFSDQYRTYAVHYNEGRQPYLQEGNYPDLSYQLRSMLNSLP